jgi:hypothetical protein
VELEVRLTVSPVRLPPIAVSVNTRSITGWLAARGFAQRGLENRARVHLTYEELGRGRYGSLEALLRNVPGVRIRRLTDDATEIVLDPNPLTGEGSCPVSVYLNGAYVEFGRVTWLGVLTKRNAVHRWLMDHPFERAGRRLKFDDLAEFRDIDGLELYGPEANPVAPDESCGTLLIWSAKLRPSVDEYLTGEVRGLAVDARTGVALQSVRVTIEATGLSALTDSTGAFSIPSVLPGRYRVSATYPNAEPWQADIEIRAYEVVDLDLRLDREAERRVAISMRDARSRQRIQHPLTSGRTQRGASHRLPPQAVKGSSPGKAADTPPLTWR